MSVRLIEKNETNEKEYLGLDYDLMRRNEVWEVKLNDKTYTVWIDENDTEVKGIEGISHYVGDYNIWSLTEAQRTEWRDVIVELGHEPENYDL